MLCGNRVRRSGAIRRLPCALEISCSEYTSLQLSQPSSPLPPSLTLHKRNKNVKKKKKEKENGKERKETCYKMLNFSQICLFVFALSLFFLQFKLELHLSHDIGHFKWKTLLTWANHAVAGLRLGAYSLTVGSTSSRGRICTTAHACLWPSTASDSAATPASPDWPSTINLTYRGKKNEWIIIIMRRRRRRRRRRRMKTNSLFYWSINSKYLLISFRCDLLEFLSLVAIRFLLILILFFFVVLI